MPQSIPFTFAEGFQRTPQDLIAAAMTVQKVGPKTVWNAQAGRQEQKKSRRGIPQWTAYTLFTPLPNDFIHEPEVVPVTVTSEKQPDLPPNTRVEFTNFATWVYTRQNQNGQTHVYRSFMADGVQPVEDENGDF
ncbi:hypothetical protein [Bifidobacterium miconisargentati]|uniref:hypothetical protein n=1 Tax=Bifidobacterium miconisargentati TaxID=2834437 RepID=UPI001BDD7D23|nr:hypothetical protein [Bifidobacterium miconisargentati]MBW3091335.1 hypothetical protein [Bifidobacterium miconisargentati]